ncbi:MAG: GGDEF domain-containing protein [Roseiarcus sp.]
MEIRDTKSISGPAATRKAGSRVRVEAATGSAAVDLVTLSGIPEAELTPKVRQALMSLLAEIDQLRREVGDARARIEYLERLADEDALMPIANRRAFLRELSRMISFAQRYGAPASIVYVDVNEMKAINDEFGHAAGDAALMQVSRTLVENVRASDVVGRLGGDEFGILLVQADQTIAEHKAAQLAEAVVAHPLVWQGRPIPLSIAYGVHAFDGTVEAGSAIDAADRAMYARKYEGRGDKPSE